MFRLFSFLIAFKTVWLAPPWTVIKRSVGFPRDLGLGPLSILIQWSEVSRLNRTTLSMYPELYWLRIDNCNLLYIDEGAFDTNLLMVHLGLVRLPLKQLPATLGPVQMSASWVQLDNTVINNLTGGNYFLEFPKMTWLSLGNHEVLGPQLNTDILPRHLLYLYVIGCKLKHFPNLSDVVPLLQHLRIYRNYIRVIPEQSITALKQMETFYTHQNLIRTLPDIGSMKKLKILTLDDNNLARLPDMYHLLLNELRVAGNPLICDQTLCWLRMWPWKKASVLKDQPTCAGPEMSSGRRLMDVHPVDMECYQGKYCAGVRPQWHFKVKKLWMVAFECWMDGAISCHNKVFVCVEFMQRTSS